MTRRTRRRRTRQEEAEEEEEQEEEEQEEQEVEATDIKSNNPHLAGGEKSSIMDILHHFMEYCQEWIVTISSPNHPFNGLQNGK